MLHLLLASHYVLGNGSTTRSAAPLGSPGAATPFECEGATKRGGPTRMRCIVDHSVAQVLIWGLEGSNVEACKKLSLGRHARGLV